MKTFNKVITSPLVRWAYVNVWYPKTTKFRKEPKYSIQLIIPKSDLDTVKKIQQAIKNVYEQDKAKFKGMSIVNIKKPLKDGDENKSDDVNYNNAYYLDATCLTAPEIVDKQLRPITQHSEVYSGVYGRASISFYAFNKGGEVGIACSLNALQKWSDGERLGYSVKAKEEFDD